MQHPYGIVSQKIFLKNISNKYVQFGKQQLNVQQIEPKIKHEMKPGMKPEIKHEIKEKKEIKPQTPPPIKPQSIPQPKPEIKNKPNNSKQLPVISRHNIIGYNGWKINNIYPRKNSKDIQLKVQHLIFIQIRQPERIINTELHLTSSNRLIL